MHFIGDIHGNFKFLTSGCIVPEKSYLLLGDVGIGFAGHKYPEKFPDNIKFIPGNHDNPAACLAHPNCLGYHGYLKEHDMFYVGGAYSIDYMHRTIGIDWWEDEEVSHQKLLELINEFCRIKPAIMVSHDCPKFVANELFSLNKKNKYWNRTSGAFDTMFGVYKPEYWIFAHWHESISKVIDGTQFVALGIEQMFKIEGIEWNTEQNK